MITQKAMYLLLEKEKILKICLLLSIKLLIFTSLIGQQIEPLGIISNSYYYSHANGINLHSSVGELAIESFNKEGQNLTQGFLQTYKVIVSTDNLSNRSLTIKVGPNPCTSNFSVIKSTAEPLTAYLYDASYRLLKTITLGDLQTVVDMSIFPKNAYFLQVFQHKSQIFETIKIIKI